MGKKGVTHRKWTKAEKMKLVQLHLEEHMSLVQIERKYGVSNGLVSTWIKKIWKKAQKLWSHITVIHMQPYIPVNHSAKWNVCASSWQSKRWRSPA